jgi:hypothetical protein
MAIRPQPGHITAVKIDEEFFGRALVEPGCVSDDLEYLPKSFIVRAFSVAVEVKADQANVQRLIDLIASNLAKRCLGSLKVSHEAVQEAAQRLTGNVIRPWILGNRKPQNWETQ